MRPGKLPYRVHDLDLFHALNLDESVTFSGVTITKIRRPSLDNDVETLKVHLPAVLGSFSDFFADNATELRTKCIRHGVQLPPHRTLMKLLVKNRQRERDLRKFYNELI